MTVIDMGRSVNLGHSRANVPGQHRLAQEPVSACCYLP